MRFVSSKKPRLTLYAWQEGDEWLLSTELETKHGRRPIERYDSKQELEQAVSARGNKVTWL
jgi:hypothetical protein